MAKKPIDSGNKKKIVIPESESESESESIPEPDSDSDSVPDSIPESESDLDSESESDPTPKPKKQTYSKATIKMMEKTKITAGTIKKVFKQPGRNINLLIGKDTVTKENINDFLKKKTNILKVYEALKKNGVIFTGEVKTKKPQWKNKNDAIKMIKTEQEIEEMDDIKRSEKLSYDLEEIARQKFMNKVKNKTSEEISKEIEKFANDEPDRLKFIKLFRKVNTEHLKLIVHSYLKKYTPTDDSFIVLLQLLKDEDYIEYLDENLDEFDLFEEKQLLLLKEESFLTSDMKKQAEQFKKYVLKNNPDESIINQKNKNEIYIHQAQELLNYYKKTNTFPEDYVKLLMSWKIIGNNQDWVKKQLKKMENLLKTSNYEYAEKEIIRLKELVTKKPVEIQQSCMQMIADDLLHQIKLAKLSITLLERREEYAISSGSNATVIKQIETIDKRIHDYELALQMYHKQKTITKENALLFELVGLARYEYAEAFRKELSVKNRELHKQLSSDNPSINKKVIIEKIKEIEMSERLYDDNYIEYKLFTDFVDLFKQEYEEKIKDRIIEKIDMLQHTKQSLSLMAIRPFEKLDKTQQKEETFSKNECLEGYLKKPWVKHYANVFWVHFITEPKHISPLIVPNSKKLIDEVECYQGTTFLDLLLCNKKQHGDVVTITYEGEELEMVIFYKILYKSKHQQIVKNTEATFTEEKEWMVFVQQIVSERIRIIGNTPVENYIDFLKSFALEQFHRLFVSDQQTYTQLKMLVDQLQGKTVYDYLKNLGTLIVFLDKNYLKEHAKVFNDRVRSGFYSTTVYNEKTKENIEVIIASIAKLKVEDILYDIFQNPSIPRNRLDHDLKSFKETHGMELDDLFASSPDSSDFVEKYPAFYQTYVEAYQQDIKDIVNTYIALFVKRSIERMMISKNLLCETSIHETVKPFMYKPMTSQYCYDYKIFDHVTTIDLVHYNEDGKIYCFKLSEFAKQKNPITINPYTNKPFSADFLHYINGMLDHYKNWKTTKEHQQEETIKQNEQTIRGAIPQLMAFIFQDVNEREKQIK